MDKKNLKTVIILIAVAFITLQSCDKKGLVDIEQERIENNTVDEYNNALDADNFYFDTDKINYDGINYYSIGKTDIYDLLQNPFDKEDENMYYQVYKIADNFKNSIPSKTLYDNIYSELKGRKLESVKYDRLIDLDNNYDIITYNNHKSNYNDVTSSMIYDNSNYLVEIYIPNIETADLTLEPIIAIGTDLYTNNDGLNDYIPAWYINKDKSFDKILINEKDAHTSKKPVLIFSIYSKNELFEVEDPQLNDQKKSAKGGVSINTILLNRCKISYRYERDNNSEFAFGFKIKSDDFGTSTIINDKFVSIHKSNINKGINVQKRLYPYYIIASRVYGVTYERDWYVSNSNSHYVYIGGSWVWAIKCKMKYSNEWYQKVDYLNLPNNSSGNHYFSSKGYVNFSWPH